MLGSAGPLLGLMLDLALLEGLFGPLREIHLLAPTLSCDEHLLLQGIRKACGQQYPEQICIAYIAGLLHIPLHAI